MTRPRPLWTPPLRDGVSASRVAVRKGPWPHVLAFLQERLPAVQEWPERLQRGDVLDAQGRPVDPNAACVEGAVLWYWRSLPPEPRVPFEVDILHQDDHLVVVDKPHFLPVTPGGRHLQETVLVRLKRQLGLDHLVPMHRLDLETAGVLVFIVQPHTRHAYHEVLRHQRAHKVYEAVAPTSNGLTFPMRCEHHLRERAGAAFMQMDVVTSGTSGQAPSVTTIDWIRDLGIDADGREISHYRLTPHTGRKHQLRAQMNAIGLPIVGDRIYPTLQPAWTPDQPPDYAHPLQLLARRLAFDDPITGQSREFISARELALTMNR